MQGRENLWEENEKKWQLHKKINLQTADQPSLSIYIQEIGQ